MSTGKHILVIVTSHDRIDADHPTGLWFDEFSAPYTLFRQQGYEVSVASPRGGDTPIDPKSLDGYADTEENRAARAALSGTKALDQSVNSGDFDALFFPGGHGTMFDLPDNAQVKRLIMEFTAAGKPVASVCHGPSCFAKILLDDGTPFVKGRRLTAFTDSEERAVELDGLMPFLLESRLREQGAEFAAGDDWSDNVVVDGSLVTGQNPQSSAGAARAVIELLGA